MFSTIAPAKLEFPSIPSVPIDAIVIFFNFWVFFRILKTNSWFLPPWPFPKTLTVGSPPKIKHIFCSSGIFSRIFLTTSSIILGVAVIIASNIFSESNKSAFDNLFSGIYEGIDLVVQPIQEDFAQGFSGDGGQGPISFEVKKIPDERIQEIQELPGVKAAWGEVVGFAQFIKVVDGETVLLSNGFAPTFGTAWDSSEYAKQWTLLEGNAPVNKKEVVNIWDVLKLKYF